MTDASRPVRLEELTSPEVAALERAGAVALVPLGSVEQHGDHLPVGTDTMIAHAVCLAVAKRRGRTVVLPPPWYGFSPHHMRRAGTVTLSAPTMLALLGDIIGSLVHRGFSHVLMVNGHGGNGGLLDVAAATLGHAHDGRSRIAGVTYFALAAERIDALRSSPPGGTGHAGEFETSVMLHLASRLVRQDRAVATYPNPGSRFLTTDLTGRSAIRTYLDFADLSETGTLGDPSHATLEKGAAFFEAAVETLGAFVEDFAGWPVPDRSAPEGPYAEEGHR